MSECAYINVHYFCCIKTKRHASFKIFLLKYEVFEIVSVKAFYLFVVDLITKL